MVTPNNGQPSGRSSISKRIFPFILRIFFKLLYHQLAWTYDFVAYVVSVGNWQKWVEAVLPYLEGPRILEIGSGPGHLQLALQQKDVMVIGLDESRQMVRITACRLVNNGFHPRITRADVHHIPLAGESFEQVVMTFPAEFIVKPEVMAEIRRVLIPGGKAIVLSMAWITGGKAWERLAAWVNRISGETPDWDPEILDRLKPAGFEADWELIDLNNSRVLLVFLKKV
jgi:SAM-dependent methyltransferase